MLYSSILCNDHPDAEINFQIQNNWTYGEVLDENAKTHPMLRPYKTFSEKVMTCNLLFSLNHCNLKTGINQ